MLSRIEKLVLKALEKGKLTPEEISKESGLDLSSVNRAIQWLSLKGLVDVEEKIVEIVSLGEEGKIYSKEGLPERKVLNLLKERGEVDIKELFSIFGKETTNLALGWLRRKKLAEIKNGKLSLIRDEKTPDEKLLELLSTQVIESESLDDELKEALKLLKSRKNVIQTKEKKKKWIKLSQKGEELLKQGIEITEEITQLTHEILKNRSWKGREFRRYDISLPVPEFLPAKLHPLRELIEEIRDIFLRLGFEEITGPILESAFWNFDALFVPQDHPAREMQDTFYLSKPAKAELPENEVMERIKAAHEHGWQTQSKGWRYSWSREKAKVSLLRTHTTATTIRYLAKAKEFPVKVFSIGRVFRNERISFKHLPEFHQCEGIVVGDVGFSHLLGILKEFYRAMGFPKVRFRPAYFPYTEPSLEVEVFFEEKKKWLELGGAGIFRPEVTEPLGVKKPVLAWGLGLERLAMLRLGMSDIRELYMSDIKWLQRLRVM